MGMRRGWTALVAGVAIAALAPALPATAGPAPAGSAPTGSAGVTLVSGGGATVPAAATAALTGGRAGGSTFAPKGAEVPKFKKEAAPGSVLGPDGRIQESISATSPWGSIVHIESNRGGCSGFLINRDTVVTAGHCVYNGGWATSYTVYPGRNGLNYKPFGSCSGGAADLWSNSIWTSSQNADYDYGMIKLTCDVGYSTGWMGWWYNEGESLTGQYFYVEGFPGDKAYGTMWWDGDTISSQTVRRAWYVIDTAPGQSGSPLYRYRSSTEGLCAGWCITGIHTTGNQGDNLNKATRFNAEVMGIVNYVANLP